MHPPPPAHPVPGSGNSGNSGNPGQHNPELSFEDFTAMSPFLDPAALHLAAGNPYASSLASSAAMASGGEFV